MAQTQQEYLFPVTIYMTPSLASKLDKVAENAHEKGIRDRHWGRSSAGRELIERFIDIYMEELKKEKKK